ncbi:hypothetical protein O6H91_02G150100 [Diphasiastrum complanatum]|nr:hypothetical protein O6H91_02G150100 [Diphasiastrum complanatum]
MKRQRQEEWQRQDEPENHLKFLGKDCPPVAALPAAPSLKQSQKKSSAGKNLAPLAERMRPATVDDVIGQDHLLGPRGILRTLLDRNKISSAILWGPPGTGKTSLARAISRAVSYRFVALSADTSGVKEVRQVLEEAKRAKKHEEQTLFFLDEIHKFNKAQQDTFLPYVEAGHIVFIGATTENPSFEINTALLSRCKVLILKRLQPEHLSHLIERAVLDEDKGILASFPEAPTFERFRVEETAIQFLASAADGDARVALNTLELAGRTAVSRFKKTAQGSSCRVFDKEDDDFISSFSFKKEFGASDRAMVGFMAKRDGNLSISKSLKENVQHSQEHYTRTFKQFAGGKQVAAHTFGLDREMTSLVHADVEKEVAGTARESKENESFIVSNSFFKNSSSKFGSLSEQHNVRLETFGNASADRDPAKGSVVVTLADVREALQRSHVFYDKTGEEHYNLMSALRKSMRGGDANAGLYWLARMIEGGERPLYVARRLIRFATKEVGLADPHALVQAVACFQACQLLGDPECNVQLAQCVIYLALAPKSTAIYQGIVAAQQLVRESGQSEPVPLHLQNAPTRGGERNSYRLGRFGPVNQEYMPPSLSEHLFLKNLPRIN